MTKTYNLKYTKAIITTDETIKMKPITMSDLINKIDNKNIYSPNNNKIKLNKIQEEQQSLLNEIRTIQARIVELSIQRQNIIME